MTAPESQLQDNDPSRPIHRRSWSRYHWQRWRRAAAWLAAESGEPPDVYEPLLTVEWKNLRHHAISRWAAAGASTLQVSRWSGDAITTIDKHYAHLFDEDEAAIMAAVE